MFWLNIVTSKNAQNQNRLEWAKGGGGAKEAKALGSHQKIDKYIKVAEQIKSKMRHQLSVDLQSVQPTSPKVPSSP